MRLIVLSILSAIFVFTNCNEFSTATENPAKPKNYVTEIKNTYESRYFAALTQALNFEDDLAFKSYVALLTDSLKAISQEKNSQLATIFSVASFLSLKKIVQENYWFAKSELRNVVNIKTTDARINAMLTDFKTEILLATADFDDAMRNSKTLGYVQDWKFIGPFRNDTGTGMEISYEPEDLLPTQNEKIEGFIHQVGWRDFEHKFFNGILPLQNVIYPTTNACAYTIAILDNADESSQYITSRVSSDCAFKIWINGKSCYFKNAKRGLHFDQDVVGIELEPGLNILLMKWGSTSKNGLSGKVRLTAPDGSKNHKISIVPANSDWWRKFETAKQKWDYSHENHQKLADKEDLKGNFNQDLKHPIKGLSESTRLYLQGLFEHEFQYSDPKSRIAGQFIKSALDHKPESSIYLYYAGIWGAEITDLKVEAENNFLRESLSKALKFEPEILIAITDLAAHYIKVKKIEQAFELLKVARVKKSDCPEITRLLLEIYEQKGWDLEIKLTHSRLFNKWQSGEIGAKFLMMLKPKNIFEKNAIVEFFIDNFNAWELRVNKLKLMFQMGKIEKALRFADKLISIDSYDEKLRLAKIKFLNSLENYDDSIDEIQALIKISPNKSTYYRKLGDAYILANYSAQADAAWKKALKLNPQDDALKKYFQLGNDQNIEFEKQFFDDTDALIEKARNLDFRTDLPFEYIYNHQIYVIESDGSYKVVSYEIKRVTNDEGAANLESDVPFSFGFVDGKILFAKVHSSDGTSQQALVDDGYVDFGQLEVGDFVEIASETLYKNDSIFGDYFGKTFLFAEYQPIMKFRLTICLPKNREFRIHPLKMLKEAKIDEDNERDLRIYNFSRENIPAIEEEPEMPEIEELAEYLQLSTYKNWDEFAHWYSNLINKQTIVTRNIQNVTQQIIAGKKDKTEQIKAIFEFIANKIRYDDSWVFNVHGYKPYSADSILRRQFGDCKDKTILLITMLQEIGVTAYPALVNSEYNRSREDITLPILEHFNHAITLVEMPDGTQKFVDGTADLLPFEVTPETICGAKVVVIKPDGSELLSIPEIRAEDNRQEFYVSTDVKLNGGAELDVVRKYTSSWEPVIRAKYENSAKRNEVLEKYFSRRFGKTEISDIRFFDVHDLDALVEFSFRAKLAKFATIRNDEIHIKPVFHPHEFLNEEYSLLPTRKYDVIMPPPNSEFYKIELLLPENFRTANLPKSENLSCDFADLNFIVKSLSDKLILTYEIVFKTNRITVDDYKNWREIAARFDEIEKLTIILKKK